MDIKPANILINTGENGEWNETDIVITDFGISGELDRQTENVGTPGFASPEQWVGNADSKSDNYSFGILAVMIFSDWPTFWRLTCKPMTDQDITGMQIGAIFQQLFDAIKSLIKV